MVFVLHCLCYDKKQGVFDGIFYWTNCIGNDVKQAFGYKVLFFSFGPKKDEPEFSGTLTPNHYQ